MKETAAEAAVSAPTVLEHNPRAITLPVGSLWTSCGRTANLSIHGKEQDGRTGRNQEDLDER